MMELRKILFNKRSFISFFLITIMTCFVFAIQSRSSYSHSALESFNKNEQIYQKQYKTYVQKIMAVSESYSGISIFEKSNTFAKKRGEITSRRYKRIAGVQLKQTHGAGLVSVFKFMLVHVLILVFMIMIVFSYTDYEHLSLRLIIATTPKGRTRLVIRRIFLLTFISILMHVFLYALLLMESCVLFKEIPSFFVSVQSLSYFKDFTFPMSIGNVFILYILMSAILKVMVVMVLWMILVLCSHKSIASAIFSGLVAIEYLVYVTLSQSHPFSLLKYNNLYLCLNSIDLLRSYRTYSFMNQVIEAQRMFLCFFIIVFMILIGILLFKGHTQRTFHQSYIMTSIERILETIHSYIKLIIAKFPLVFHEFYKVIITQKGWIFLLCFIVLFIKMQDTSPYLTQGSIEQQKAIYSKYGGVYSKRIFVEYIDPCKKNYHKEVKRYKDVLKRYEEKKINKDELFDAQMRMDNIQNEYNLVKSIEVHVNKVKKNKKAWLIDQNGWKMLLSKDGHYAGEGFLTMEKEAMLIVAFICFFFSSIWDYDQRSEMNLILRATAKGRTYLYNKRILMYFIVSVLLTIVWTVVDFYVQAKVYPLTYFSAPLDSLLFFKNVPISLSINVFIVLLAIYRTLSLFALSMIINFILMKIGSFKGGFLTLILFVVPQFISMFNIDVHYLSLIQPVMILPLIHEVGFVYTSWILMIFYLIGFIAYKAGKKLWSGKGMNIWKSK